MAQVPTSYYYSGQGRVMLGERDAATGKVIGGFLQVGNVTELSIEISVDKFEHKESMTGQRAVDLVIVKEKKAGFKMTAESLSLDLLSLALYGASAKVAGAAITGESVKPAKGRSIALKYPNVSAVTIKKNGSTAVPPSDYELDAVYGTIYVKPATVLAQDEVWTVDYTYGAHTRLDAFTQATQPERFLRFEGLNTVNGDAVLVELPKAAFEPLTGLQLINEELANAEINGNILPDLTITSGSQYFIERIVGKADLPPTP